MEWNRSRKKAGGADRVKIVNLSKAMVVEVRWDMKRSNAGSPKVKREWVKWNQMSFSSVSDQK